MDKTGTQYGGLVAGAPAITITNETALAHALQLTLSRQVKRLPARGEEGRLIGLPG